MLRRMAGRLANVWSRPESPRELQERADLYRAVLASTYRSLRRRDGDDVSVVRGPPEVLESLVERATEMTEKDLVHEMTLLELRRLVQRDVLAPETRRLFAAFDRARSAIAVDDQTTTTTTTTTTRSLLTEDLDETSRELALGDRKSDASTAFFVTKLGALRAVLDGNGWTPPIEEAARRASSATSPSSSSSTDDFGDRPDENDDDDDDFEKAESSLRRRRRGVDLSLARVLRRELGHATVALRSTVPNAGRGVFVDGLAPAGSIVAFFPGEVWPRESLSTTASRLLDDDDRRLQLSMRYDDVLVDSRRASRVASSNPWALAHLANHPTSGRVANCRPLALNYTTEMGLPNDHRRSFVPNAYARPPPLLGINAAFEHEDVYMHGMVLATTRDVENEELLYDYRLNSASLPDWYEIYDEEESRNRWQRR